MRICVNLGARMVSAIFAIFIEIYGFFQILKIFMFLAIFMIFYSFDGTF